MFVVTVVFDVKSGKIPEFTAAMLEQARNSLELEPGCVQFDICRSLQYPEQFFLYEVYQDEQAFDMHLDSAHFGQFDVAVAPLVDNKTVQVFNRLD